jgi:hypothetical protein
MMTAKEYEHWVAGAVCVVANVCKAKLGDRSDETPDGFSADECTVITLMLFSCRAMAGGHNLTETDAVRAVLQVSGQYEPDFAKEVKECLKMQPGLGFGAQELLGD